MYIFFYLIMDIKKNYTNNKVKKLLTNCIYLENEEINIEGLSIFGCPWHLARKKNFSKKVITFFYGKTRFAAFALEDEDKLEKKLK